jgi:UDP-2,3-diacylglucosamine pyrophosphatase LpxH
VVADAGGAGDVPAATAKGDPGFSVAEVPESMGRPLPRLIADLKDTFRRRKEYWDARECVDVTVRMDGPIGVANFGDPHLGNPGTDVAAIEHDTALVAETEGMFAATVGDITDNWIGRLQAIYKETESTEHDSIRMAKWFFDRCDGRWLYIVGGNHDAWHGGLSPWQWLLADVPAVKELHGVRFRLNFPNGRKVVMNARHHFKGYSQWNEAHGMVKYAKMGMRESDHVLTCGHLHHNAYHVIGNERLGLTHCIRVAAYKRYDDYARSHVGVEAWESYAWSPCVGVVVDPYSPTEAGLVTVVQGLGS